VFLGDNVYGDTRDMRELRARYEQLAGKPGFRRLRERTPILAIWDDHDYGENDAGGDFPLKHESRRSSATSGASPRTRRDARQGIHAAYRFGEGDRRVQIILPDLRFNRTPLVQRDLGNLDYEDLGGRALRTLARPVPGPYDRNPDRTASMLGEAQWAWLEAQLQVPAEIRIFAPAFRLRPTFPAGKPGSNYPRDHDRLIDAIRRHRANGLFCISGDTHWAELSLLDLNVPYPLWDLTSSGLTETWPVLPPNALRVGEAYREVNFGVIEIDWSSPVPAVRLSARDINGAPVIEHALDVAALRV
jgi:alkaline phosphatase D